ncbi:SGNH/GDSL hydrolase family protein [Methylobacterium planeticum]|uniref:SGNH/GDSL hydrolase family protein n=1 Tax=Methylobacterium planeticum TaxID=2615211 RepID=A0A6N6MKA1_9HYPH|nr:GDSL-type esterase/lipase family protein [Methylobacterium planeticum]KAB1070052.1 SGNH/GDSL hydrolase family protein [Methylobacterium planeticum]
MLRTVQDGRAKVLLALGRGWRRAACGAAFLAGLSLSSTAVLAYADLLPPNFLPPDLGRTLAAYTVPESLPDRASGLPHLAERVASGDPVRIVAFGSSSTEGIGASSPRAAYPARLEAALRRALPQRVGGISVLNRGIGGEHVDDMLRRLDRDVLAAQPQLVIWQTGSNDPLRGIALDHFREATIRGIERMREAGIEVVLMEPQWCPKLDATPGSYRFRDAVRDIGAALDVPVIRRSDLMRGWIADGRLTRSQLFAADGLHMADDGYEMLAQAASRQLLRATGSLTVADAGASQD